jgi:hypothetical protein
LEWSTDWHPDGDSAERIAECVDELCRSELANAVELTRCVATVRTRFPFLSAPNDIRVFVWRCLDLLELLIHAPEPERTTLLRRVKNKWGTFPTVTCKLTWTDWTVVLALLALAVVLAFLSRVMPDYGCFLIPVAVLSGVLAALGFDLSNSFIARPFRKVRFLTLDSLSETLFSYLVLGSVMMIYWTGHSAMWFFHLAEKNQM